MIEVSSRRVQFSFFAGLCCSSVSGLVSSKVKIELG